MTLVVCFWPKADLTVAYATVRFEKTTDILKAEMKGPS
jgi:hypothetical protein